MPYLAAVRLQWKRLIREPGSLADFIVAPLLAFLFFVILAHAGRRDLFAYALFAPVLITVWSRSVYAAGEILEADRWTGVLEAMLATPAHPLVVTLGRTTVVTALALVALVEVWLLAWLVFGHTFAVAQPALLIATLAFTAFSAATTGLLIAALVLGARDPRTFQNSITYPFYVVGGVLVPVTYLPDWIQPLSNLIFLSWSSALLRDSLVTERVLDAGVRLLAILGLGLAALLIGWVVADRRIALLKRNGKVGHA